MDFFNHCICLKSKLWSWPHPFRPLAITSTKWTSKNNYFNGLQQCVIVLTVCICPWFVPFAISLMTVMFNISNMFEGSSLHIMLIISRGFSEILEISFFFIQWYTTHPVFAIQEHLKYILTYFCTPMFGERLVRGWYRDEFCKLTVWAHRGSVVQSCSKLLYCCVINIAAKYLEGI